MEQADISTQNLLQLGIKAAQAKRKADAYQLLSQVVRRDPRNEQGWLWLAAVAPTPQESLSAFEQVLAINPNNEQARVGQRWAQGRLGNAPATAAATPAAPATPPAAGRTPPTPAPPSPPVQRAPPAPPPTQPAPPTPAPAAPPAPRTGLSSDDLANVFGPPRGATAPPPEAPAARVPAPPPAPTRPDPPAPAPPMPSPAPARVTPAPSPVNPAESANWRAEGDLSVSPDVNWDDDGAGLDDLNNLDRTLSGAPAPARVGADSTFDPALRGAVYTPVHPPEVAQEIDNLDLSMDRPTAPIQTAEPPVETAAPYTPTITPVAGRPNYLFLLLGVLAVLLGLLILALGLGWFGGSSANRFNQTAPRFFSAQVDKKYPDAAALLAPQLQSAYKDANNDLPDLNLNSTLTGLSSADTRIVGAPLANDPNLTTGESVVTVSSPKLGAPLNYLVHLTHSGDTWLIDQILPYAPAPPK